MKYALAMLGLIVCVSGCMFYPTLSGSGTLVQESADFQGFRKISADDSFEVMVVKDAEYGITITVDDNILEHVQMRKEGEQLQLELDPYYNYRNVTLKALVTTPALDAIELSGASDMTVVNADQFPYVPSLDIDLSGASTLLLPMITAGTVRVDFSGASSGSIGLQASNIAVDLSGASELQVNGTGGDLTAEVSGASELDMSSCTVGDVDANLSGASRAWVTMDGILDADLSGGSTLYYRGTMVLGSLDTSGGSKLRSY